MRTACSGLRYACLVEISQIVIVHHRTPEVLERALARLALHAEGIPVRVLDTAPEPGTGELVRRAHPGARACAARNHSYAAVVNRALREAPGPLVMVMNADVLIEAGTVRALSAPFADPGVGATGPVARTAGGAVQDQGLPYRWWTAPLTRGSATHAVREVPWLSGCLFVARIRAARDAGGMDPSLRFGNEDLEWCLRLRSRGWRCVLVGAAVVHLGGSSTPDLARFRIEGLRGGMIVAQRHHRPWRRILQRGAVGGYAAVRALTGPRHRRAGWRAVATMMWRGSFHESPFGPTLAEANPRFSAVLGERVRGWDDAA